MKLETFATLVYQLSAVERAEGPETPRVIDLSSQLRTHVISIATADIFALIASTLDNQDARSVQVLVQSLGERGDYETFAVCRDWAKEKNAARREVAAEILAELGGSSRKPFANQSLPILLALLGDSHERVIASALWACGKLKIAEPDVLTKFVSHPNRTLRRAAVDALSGRDDAVSISALVHSTRDVDADIRNWSTFYLSQLSEANTVEIRDALLARIDDDDVTLAAEIRGEALIGLAKRGDMRVLDALERELDGAFHGARCIEAATHLNAPSLAPLLVALKSRLAAEDIEAFGDELEAAVAARTPRDA